jgi:hypothetical protein
MVLRRLLFGVGLWWAFQGAPLWAQSALARPLGLPKPVVSPYLDLLRRGGSPAFNYLTLVRPELDTQKALGQLNTQILQATSPQVAGHAYEGDTTTTGHPFGFQTQRRYFMNFGSGGSSGGGRASAPQRATPQVATR